MRAENPPEVGLPQKSAPQIPLDDPEAAARYLVEMMPPAMRRELGPLLCQPDWADDEDMLL
jgi:hypothetical protein